MSTPQNAVIVLRMGDEPELFVAIGVSAVEGFSSRPEWVKERLREILIRNGKLPANYQAPQAQELAS